MKQQLLILLLSVFTFGFTETNVHPIHISLAEVDYRTDKKEIQVALKIFTDDLEDAIKADGKRLYLDSSKEIKNADTYVKQYLERNFKVTVDKKQPVLKYLGKEYIDDGTWVYFYYTGVSKRAKSISIKNTVITSLHSGQKNIMNVKKDKKLVKSKTLKKGNATMIIKF